MIGYLLQRKTQEKILLSKMQTDNSVWIYLHSSAHKCGLPCVLSIDHIFEATMFFSKGLYF